VTLDAEMFRGIMAKAEEKLSRAERDLADGFPDDAASRAYYAAFHGITAVLATKGLSFSSHRQTIGAFNREFIKTGMFPPDSSRQLRSLFEDRQIGDYEWSRKVDAQTAAEDVAAAKTLVAACRQWVEDRLAGHAT
jgi:uncharacterized protein (UPF0332 family)